MIQEINLYQPIFRRERIIFSAVTLLYAMAIVALGLMFIYGIGAFTTSQLEAERDQLKRTEQENLKRLATLSAQLKPKPKSALLEHKITQLEKSLVQKQLLLAYLDDDAFGNRTGFSQHLEGLARQIRRDLWLTGFAFDQGGRHVQLQGQTTAPVNLPRYLQRLSNEQAFTGQDFTSIKIQRDEKRPGTVDFYVTSQKEGGS